MFSVPYAKPLPFFIFDALFFAKTKQKYSILAVTNHYQLSLLRNFLNREKELVFLHTFCEDC